MPEIKEKSALESAIEKEFLSITSFPGIQHLSEILRMVSVTARQYDECVAKSADGRMRTKDADLQKFAALQAFERILEAVRKETDRRRFRLERIRAGEVKE